jgi:hypothetical protein
VRVFSFFFLFFFFASLFYRHCDSIFFFLFLIDPLVAFAVNIQASSKKVMSIRRLATAAGRTAVQLPPRTLSPLQKRKKRAAVADPPPTVLGRRTDRRAQKYVRLSEAIAV